MAVIADRFVYDVSDPVNPRLVCRAVNTFIHLDGSGAIAYTTTANGRTQVIRRDLTTGAESQIAQLPADPRASPLGTYWPWTSDGSLEAFPVSLVSDANGKGQLQLHLWAGGADRVLVTVDTFGTGFVSRWSPVGIAEFSPDRAYLAISALIYGGPWIFSVADQRQVFGRGPGQPVVGGKWLADNRFVWATGSSPNGPAAVMQWTLAGGASVFRTEEWYAPTSSAEGSWVAATLPLDAASPRVVFTSLLSGKRFEAGAASRPGFISPSVAWYAEEGPCATLCAIQSIEPNGTFHAFDVTTGSDRAFGFRSGEEPITDGVNYCCFTGPR